MAVTDLTIQTIGEGRWEITFSATSTPVHLYVNGNRQHTWDYGTSGDTYRYILTSQEPATIDITEGDDEPARHWPDRLTLGWYRVNGAQSYQIDEYVDDEWITRAIVPDTYAQHGYYTWYYTWASRRLEDVTEHQFRVVPRGPGEVPGTATSLTALMVRTPDPPDPEYDYDEDTRVLTVSHQ